MTDIDTTPDITSTGYLARREASVPTGLDVDTLIRSQRRVNLLQTYATDFVLSSPAAAMALAQSANDDDEMLKAATEAVGFSNIEKIRKDLVAESDEVQQTVWANLPKELQRSLQQLGYVTPTAAKKGDGGRLFGSIPVVGQVAERVLDWGAVPGIGGALEEAQHFMGEGVEGVGQAGGTALHALSVPVDQVAHAYRATVYAREEGQTDPGGFTMFSGSWTPGEIAKAWRETGDEDDSYIRPGHEERAHRLVDNDPDAYRLAYSEAMGKSMEEVIDLFGYEPGSQEATQLVAKYTSLQGTHPYRQAVTTIKTGQVSFGRIIAQEAFGLDDTDAGLGRAVSGLLDAGFLMFLDPLLVAGKFSKGYRFGRNAFRLDQAGAATAQRQSDLALAALRAREGSDVGEMVSSGLNKVSSADMRLGRNILRWSDRVARGFRDGDWASLQRDLPNVATGLHNMSDYHSLQKAQGLRGLDDTLGVVEYLQSRDGILNIVGTRVGGASPMAWGYRMPTLTPLDRARMVGKKAWTDVIDYSRFVGATPERVYGPKFRQVIQDAGNPRAFGRQSARWLGSKTLGSTGRTISMLTSHVPYRDAVYLDGPESIPEFTRLVNMGLFGGMSRQHMDDVINAWVKGDTTARAEVQEKFLDELFRAGGVQDLPFAKRFTGRLREAYAIDPESGSRRLVDISEAESLAIPDPRQYLAATYRVNTTRAIFHGTPSSWADAQLGRFWKPSVLIRVGFIARAAGEELLHHMLKYGPRVYLGSVGSHWVAKNAQADVIRAQLEAAEALGHADDINRLRHQLAETEGSIIIAPIRAMMAGSDRMFTQLFLSTKDDAARWRQRLAEKAERFDPQGKYRTVSGFERQADRMALYASGLIGKLNAKTPGSLTKAELGRMMAEHWNPNSLYAARMLLRNPRAATAFAEGISGSTMTPFEFRSVLDADGVPVPKVQFGAVNKGNPVMEEIELRDIPGEAPLDRITDDPNFHNSIFTRHGYSRQDRVERAVVDNVLPRYVGAWEQELTSLLGYDDIALLRNDLNKIWAHEWSPAMALQRGRLGEAEAKNAGFESGADALGFLRRYVDKDVDEELPKGWIGSRLKDLFEDAGTSMSAGRLINLLDDPKFSEAAKRWLLYDHIDSDRLIKDSGELVERMKRTARARLARPDMAPKLRGSRLYQKGEFTLARPVERGITKVYVPLMPVGFQGGDLADDFVEAATARIFKIGGYSPEQATEIARNVAAASVGNAIEEARARLGLVPLAGWGSSDPRVTEAVMAAAEDVTGEQAVFGILGVPDEVIERSTDRVLAQGLLRKEGAIDFSVDGWRLASTQPTTQTRRYARVDVDDEAWDLDDLRAAEDAFEAPPLDGNVRVYSSDHTNWDVEQPDGPFWFADVPDAEAGRESVRSMLESFRTSDLRKQAQILGIKGYSKMRKADLIGALEARPELRTVLERQGAGGAGVRILDEHVDQARKLPGAPGTYSRDNYEVSEGLGEITALERAADRTVDEVTEIFTTIKKLDMDDDVLHEIVEPLKRPSRRTVDEATGVETFTPGYDYRHLVLASEKGRLPTQSYGPKLYAGRWSRWGNFVREWFDGPVNKAISSIIRKPMFLNTYGEQLASVSGVADLLVDPRAREAASAWANSVGVADEDLDMLVTHIIDMDVPKTQFVEDDVIRAAIEDYSRIDVKADSVDLDDLKRYATQRHWAVQLASDNALNRAMQLTIPYIDDHRIRSAFQNYVGNFIPFHFAEEQFLKRWMRSVAESPEMIRKAQLAMNGLRSMGTVRRDQDGRELFVYPLIGDAAEVLSKPIEWFTGQKNFLPYSVQMTGDVGYTLPGFGDQMGVPSGGPLVGIGVEYLSRHFPELAPFEDVAVGRGANRPLWQYVVPSGAAKLYEAALGDVDTPALASAQIQAMQTMAINGQLPPETASPEERQEFEDRARQQTRFLLGIRAMFGLAAPAAPGIRFEHDELTEEFRSLLQADVPFEDSIRLYLANHPDLNPADILAATVSATESDYSGLDMPTDAAFAWVNEHKDLVQAYPAAAAWLAPRADTTDTFSRRAYDQQLAMGLRHRKEPKEFIDDIYFRVAAQDYFEMREQVQAATTGLSGTTKRIITEDWEAWKNAYFTQHPLFAVMLQDPERQQKRAAAIDQLVALSAREDDLVAPEMKEMMLRFRDFQTAIAALRGDRREAVSIQRSTLVSETAAWMQWHISRNTHLAAPYLRLIEPELRDADEDAVMEALDG